MKSYKSGISKIWAVMALNQLANYLKARNTYSGLQPLSVEHHSADALFGGEGVFDDADLKPKMTELAENLSVELYLVRQGKSVAAPLSVEERVENTDAYVLDNLGFREMFTQLFPELV